MPASTKQLGFVTPRPLLPLEHANPHIKLIDPSKPPPVKFQEIVRDGQATIVGRLKIQTPNGHSFILRRLDTGAISLTTMFRAAFPTASEDAERAEAVWVKTSYDINGANKTGKSRFAGTWVNPEVALSLAEEYNLGAVISVLVKAEPDPNIVYRRSSRAQQPTPTASPAARAAQASPQTKEAGPGPAKRRREASPASSPAPTPAPVPAPAVTVAQRAAEVTIAPTPPPSVSRLATSPTPRRSARLKSPAPAATPAPAPVAVKTPRSTRAQRKELPVPTASDETAVDEDADPDSPDMAQLAEDTMHDDIREQKELIAKLKAEREQQQAKVNKAAEKDAEGATEQVEEVQAPKRPREEEILKFDFAEPKEETGERAIATNSRVRVLGNMPPERKSLAWGALAFAAGLGAMSFLPNLQSYLPF